MEAHGLSSFSVFFDTPADLISLKTASYIKHQDLSFAILLEDLCSICQLFQTLLYNPSYRAQASILKYQFFCYTLLKPHLDHAQYTRPSAETACYLEDSF